MSRLGAVMLGAVLGSVPTAMAASESTVPVQVYVMALMPQKAWSVDVNGRGQLSVSHVEVGKSSRSLTRVEKRKLKRLVARLPRGRKQYGYGTCAVDGTVFELRVGAGSGERVYTVCEELGPDAKGRGTLATLETIKYLRALVPSGAAAWPPPGE